MSVPFEIPDWLLHQAAQSSAPPDTSDVNPHKVEDLVNRFIAGKQDALFDAPDAYYRTTGADAVDGAPAILDRLNGLKSSTLDAAGDDGMRSVLAPRLDAHMDDASDGISRHVTAQRDVLARQTLAERQHLIQHAAELEHNNDDKLAGLADAHASAAQVLAQMNGEPEGPAKNAARSAIWSTAINQRLAHGNAPQAIAPFDKVKDRLAPDDHLALNGPVQVVRDDEAANQWIANQIGTDGPPLQDRAAADPSLSPDAMLLVRAKLDARDSAQEASHAATVTALDDQIAERHPNPRDDAWRLQDRHTLRDRKGLRRCRRTRQGRDPFAAGTTLYDEVGPPVPIDDIQGRLQQAGYIAEMRGSGSVVPLTAAAIDERRGGTEALSDASPEAPQDVDQLAQMEIFGKPPSYVPKPRPAPRPSPAQKPDKSSPKTGKSKSDPSPPSDPETPREYKEPIPGLSGKEKADDIPSAFKGERSYVGESGKDAARRLFDILKASLCTIDWPVTSASYGRTVPNASWPASSPRSCFSSWSQASRSSLRKARSSRHLRGRTTSSISPC